ncbi:MAG: hypothetical protein GF329_14320, partial [Candidatus Lokiarchaeota archaeon]|nr:hypothetical protein [Candidatus Lokiarchaeota archaeon]
ASIAYDVEIIDLTHNVPKYNIKKGALILYFSGKYFPKNTIHLVVIDPGVGSERLPIVIKTQNFYLIGPDNGVLSPLAKYDRIEKIFTLENEKYFLNEISKTFHGRDIFAPVAAHLANGVPISNFGKEIHKIKTLKKFFYSEGKIKGANEITCNAIDVDNFGNIITNVSEKQLFTLINKLKKLKQKKLDKRIKINIKISKGSEFKDHHSISKINFPFKTTYSQVGKGEYLSLIGSHGNLEFSQNQGNASINLKIFPEAKLTMKILL